VNSSTYPVAKSPTSGRRLTRRRRIAFAIAAVLLVFTIAVGVLLGIDTYLHHRVQNLGGVNVWGYRGPVVGRKQPGETRVVVLGGSTAFGYGLPWTEAFPYDLEQTLNGNASAARRFRVINLGAPGQGAFGFRVDLSDYAFLRYDVVIFYEGYNDLGAVDLPEGVPKRYVENRLLFRRQSPIFRLTGYFPVLPLVFREKAMAMRAGGDLDGAYRGRVAFSPGLATRATASAIQSAAEVAEAVGRVLGRLTPGSSASAAAGPLDTSTWREYTTNVVQAVRDARGRGAKAIVVTQPYASDSHVGQQRALAAALASAFADDRFVRYVNLGSILDIRDREVAYDGLHLTARANRVVADHLSEPLLDMLR
jgi:lysophospholipase L1-like esterase